MTDATKKKNISAAIVSLDATDELERTLANTSQWAHETIVVNVASSERTRKLANQYGAHLAPHNWQDDLSAARNAALAVAEGDWVLWLEPGETLEQAAVQELQRTLNENASAGHAIMLLVVAPPMADAVSAEQAGSIRLAPNHPGIRFQGRVCEEMQSSIEAAGLQLEALPIKIQRGEWFRDEKHLARQAQRDIALASLELNDGKTRPEVVNRLAEAYRKLGEHSRAQQLFQQAAALSEAGTAPALEAYYGWLSCLDAATDNLELKTALCLRALDDFPVDIQLLCAMGGYLQTQGRLDLARRAYRTAHEHGQANPFVWNLVDIHEVAAFFYSRALFLGGESRKAATVLQESLLQYPHATRLGPALLECYIQQGEEQAAEELATRLATDAAEERLLRATVRGAILAAKNQWTKANEILLAAYRGGCRHPLCLRWLSLSFLNLQEHPSAASVVDVWIEHEPHNGEAQQLQRQLASSCA